MTSLSSTPTNYTHTLPKGTTSKWVSGMSRVASRWFGVPDRINQKMDRFINSHSQSGTRSALKPLAKLWKKVGQYVLSFDHHERINNVLMSPSKGAFFLIVIPFTVVPRIIQALKRSTDDNDKAEFGDIIFRDSLTLFFLLYALKPIRKWMTKLMGKHKGINLSTKSAGIFNTSHTHNLFQINSANSVSDMLRPIKHKKNGHVTLTTFKTTLNKTLQQWEATLSGVMNPSNKTETTKALQTLSTHIKAFKHALNQVTQNTLADSDKLNQASHDLFKHSHQIDQWISQHAKQANVSEPIKSLLKKPIVSVGNSLARMANKSMTRVSIGSFLLVCSLIGVFPPFANEWKNKRAYTRRKTNEQQQHAQQLLNHLARPLRG